MILVVDMNWKKESLAYSEFVSPIISIVEPLEPFEVKHFLDVDPSQLGGYGRIILSGTALKDFAAQEHAESFQWIKTFDRPILGICAGMRIISRTYGVPLEPCLQVGMTEIVVLKENPLFQRNFKAYALHSYSVMPSQTFYVLAESSKCIQAIKHKQKPIYGVLFHPEVRNQDILKQFVKLNYAT